MKSHPVIDCLTKLYHKKLLSGLESAGGGASKLTATLPRNTELTFYVLGGKSEPKKKFLKEILHRLETPKEEKRKAAPLPEIIMVQDHVNGILTYLNLKTETAKTLLLETAKQYSAKPEEWLKGLAGIIDFGHKGRIKMASLFLDQQKELELLLGNSSSEESLKLQKSPEQLVSTALEFKGNNVEFNKTIMNKFCLHWLLKGHYHYFSENQADYFRPSKEDFNKLSKFFKKAVAQDFTIFNYYDTIHDLIKGEEAQKILRKYLGQEIIDAIERDHDDVLIKLLADPDELKYNQKATTLDNWEKQLSTKLPEIQKELFPSLIKIKKKIPNICSDLRNIAYYSNLPFGRLMQLTAPASALYRLKPLLKNTAGQRILRLVIAHKLLDAIGFYGGETQQGSKTMNRINTGKTVEFCQNILNSKNQKDLIKAYDTYFKSWQEEIKIEGRIKDRSAITQISSATWNFTGIPDFNSAISDAFEELEKENPKEWQILATEMPKKGSLKDPAILLSYGLANMGNIIKAIKEKFQMTSWESFRSLNTQKQKEFLELFKDSMKKILIIHANIYDKVRKYTKKPNVQVKTSMIEVLLKDLSKHINKNFKGTLDYFKQLKQLRLNYNTRPISIKIIPSKAKQVMALDLASNKTQEHLIP